MPLNATALAGDIEGAITGYAGAGNTTAQVSNLAQAIATAVVNHIKANAVVNVASVSGVTAGGAVSGPGTGTIS